MLDPAGWSGHGKLKVPAERTQKFIIWLPSHKSKRQDVCPAKGRDCLLHSGDNIATQDILVFALCLPGQLRGNRASETLEVLEEDVIMDQGVDSAQEGLFVDICRMNIDDFHSRERRGNLGKDGSECGGDVRDVCSGKDDIKSEEAGHMWERREEFRLVGTGYAS
ncbi:hypothetical protein C8J57DRAFT_1230873 [Mycena rebaudengoi]|nr:hypothetical protein C8J57DRAFT_1230873 [Mycena rebaudengoi]